MPPPLLPSNPPNVTTSQEKDDHPIQQCNNNRKPDNLLTCIRINAPQPPFYVDIRKFNPLNLVLCDGKTP